MLFNNQKNIHVAQSLTTCLPEFSHINHYWDKERASVVAKILPGEFYMTKDDILIATTLGSCIAACIWDKSLGIGGMNHFMLPLIEKEAHEVEWGQRGLTSDATRYGNFAMEHLINLILKCGGRRINLRAKLFGGGKVLKQMSDIGQKNIEFARQYLAQENIVLESADLGDCFPRKVLFHPKTGKAFVKKLNNLHNDTIVKREFDYRNHIDKEPVDGDIELF
ncbi:putative chemoreceptor glutamine deamidase CheD 1 [Thalassotalea insulae]|uniref:Probable chemoreceptor glutamine deamidase CheD n=1 Tax=Thalassotalea insulae TaxID=2056778 RepID=A0ABQ6GN72_9GAMM|nr:chemoreceptor glutamine deamidase CheD [Thalassotalea insulae]GLX76822.1 putative chemoreceptor glutamine deamidase CheD 1 [Thalassotalea insulae]